MPSSKIVKQFLELQIKAVYSIPKIARPLL